LRLAGSIFGSLAGALPPPDGMFVIFTWLLACRARCVLR
jgi:hypothetical protein